MKDVLKMTHDEMGDVMETWNKGELDCFLVEITRDILRFKDEDGKPLVEKIRDTAGQVCSFISFSTMLSILIDLVNFCRKELVNGLPSVLWTWELQLL
jgi:hypothetical protein